MFIGLKLAAVL